MVTAAVLVLFGVMLLACAAEVMRLAKDARADMDSDLDVFDRRRAARHVALRRIRQLLRANQAVLASRVDTRSEAPTVRLTPTHPGRDREHPTIPAIAGQ